jgi:hypothetical protein
MQTDTIIIICIIISCSCVISLILILMGIYFDYDIRNINQSKNPYVCITSEENESESGMEHNPEHNAELMPTNEESKTSQVPIIGPNNAEVKYYKIPEIESKYINTSKPYAADISINVEQKSLPSQPTNKSTNCAEINQGSTKTIKCAKGKINKITFATYGKPMKGCNNPQIGPCHANNVANILTSKCVGSSTCNIDANDSVYGQPCTDSNKKLVLQWTCK